MLISIERSSNEINFVEVLYSFYGVVNDLRMIPVVVIHYSYHSTCHVSPENNMAFIVIFAYVE